jgi:hypothetical protein
MQFLRGERIRRASWEVENGVKEISLKEKKLDLIKELLARPKNRCS